MTNLDKARERYDNDAPFRTMVDCLQHAIVDLQFTASELRDAVVFAAYMVESRTPIPARFGIAMGVDRYSSFLRWEEFYERERKT